MSKNISRRTFLKGAAAGAASVAALYFVGKAEPVKAETFDWDKEYDVVIVGAGGTGLAAAASAAEKGASVLVLEKADFAGGTTNLSGGVMQAAGTKVQKKYSKYQNDTAEKHAQFWIKSGEGLVDEELVKDLAYGAPEHIEWLETMGLKFNSVYGNCHIPYIEEEFYADRIHVYEGGGDAGGGVPLVQALLKYAEGLGAVVEYKSEALHLVKDENGAIAGLEAKQGKENVFIKANKGIILAAASIDQNKEMAKRMHPQQHWALENGVCLCAVTDTGDGIRMGQEVGADLEGLGGTIDFCGKTGAATTNQMPLFPSFIVNGAGRRFVCEDATYAYHYRAIFQQSSQLQKPTYMIFGKSSLNFEFSPWNEESTEKDVKDGVLLYAETIEELAEKIDVPAENLNAALDKWNEDAKDGKDTQFGRKDGLEPIEGPFYAYKNMPYNLGAIGGLKINKEAEVIDTNGNAIPGLYAGGLNAGGWIGPYYPGSGTAIIGTIHWGRKAGANAAAKQ